jgi:hypothetical protein
VTDEQIRDVFLAAGFEIKPGHDDLKPYVYQAARDLLADTYTLDEIARACAAAGIGDVEFQSIALELQIGAI